jgi:uncharacterized protein YcaQ
LNTLSKIEARLLALSAQGLCPRTSNPPRAEDISSIIRRMGLLQIDFVNILTPSHYLVLFSRLGPYDRTLLDQVVYQRREFIEHWAHEASIVPVEHWPLLEHRRQTHKVWHSGFGDHLKPRYLKQAIAEIRRRGPLRSDQLPADPKAPARIPGAWYGTLQRVAMEVLFGRGDLSISSRDPDFARLYDLADRIIPEPFRQTKLSVDEQQRGLLRIAAKACGVATAGDLADYFRMPVAIAKPRIAELIEAGELEPVRVEGWKEGAYLFALQPPSAATVPICPKARLLSPFDPIVWSRKRTARLFDFEYKLEIFTPIAKRKYGCFVLPVLLNGNLAARVDLKAERKEGVLAVLATYLEAGTDANALREHLPAELQSLAQWLGLERGAVIRHPHRNRDLRGTLASSRASRAAGRARS